MLDDGAMFDKLPWGCPTEARQRRFRRHDPSGLARGDARHRARPRYRNPLLVQGSEYQLALCNAIRITSLGGREHGGTAD